MFSSESITVLASGQGSQWAGMGEAIYEKSDVAKEVFHEGSEVIGEDLTEVCFGSQTGRLDDTRLVQPAIAAVALANFLELKRRGFEPDAGKGHSAGEITMFGIAGVLKQRDMFELIKARAEITHEASQKRPGFMAVIRDITFEEIKSHLGEIIAEGHVFIANKNSSIQTVISGDKDPIGRAGAIIKGVESRITLEKAKYTILKRVPGAYHSPFHMKEAELPFLEKANHFTYMPPQFPIMLNSSRYLHELGTDNLAKYLAGQLVSEVDYEGGIKRLFKDGMRRFIDVGPRDILGRLILDDYGTKVEIVDLDEVLANRAVEPKLSLQTTVK